MSFWSLVISRWNNILESTGEHVLIVLVAVCIAVIVGVALGVMITYWRFLAGPVLYFCQVVMTIPSLAMLGLLLPVFGIGYKTGVATLILYSLLPIVRNTYAGIQGIEPAIIEAAKGMGMRETTILRRIKLPLAWPVILAGIRTAVVMIVGIAAIASYIGAGGLGEFIFRGISQWNLQLVLLGALCVSVLAVLADGLLKRAESRARR
ncbi:ABC transporter permease [Moorellaceae bacterium AZ2]|uniref:ABC transporter permease n=1 Tax=Thermanaeromonas sp. C210 TaxID=2731925 RepID=UPI00155D30FD|nr:ABC transporter permease [Thermanaeromonas sp. C210]GFN23929.1 choline ABC transporter permease [Thermanaeromonas sp. C210]